MKKLLTISTSKLKRILSSKSPFHGEDCIFFPPQGKQKLNLCLVSHIDTIGDLWGKRKTEIRFSQKHQILWNPDGYLGADDRAGVWACWKLRKLTGCAVLFTDKEETGGIGAWEATKIFEKELSQFEFFLEIDRKGKGEVVFYNDESLSFRSYIESWGFRENLGIFSDIAILGKILKKPAANVSAGYQFAHSLYECLKMEDLRDTFQKVFNKIG